METTLGGWHRPADGLAYHNGSGKMRLYHTEQLSFSPTATALGTATMSLTLIEDAEALLPID